MGERSHKDAAWGDTNAMGSQRETLSVAAAYRTCHSSPFSSYQTQIHLLCLRACYRRNNKRRHSSPTDAQDELVFPPGSSALITCFCHIKIVCIVYSWIWSPVCTENFLIWKEKQVLGSYFIVSNFIWKKDKVKAHVVTSSLRVLICKWNFNFRWICIHPSQAFISRIKSTFFWASCSFFHRSFLPISSCAANTDGSYHGTDEEEMVSMCFLCMSLNLSQHEPRPSIKAQTPHI